MKEQLKKSIDALSPEKFCVIWIDGGDYTERKVIKFDTIEEAKKACSLVRSVTDEFGINGEWVIIKR